MFAPVPNFPFLNAYAQTMAMYQQFWATALYGNPFLRVGF